MHWRFDESQKPLPGQFDLSCRFSGFESALGHTDSAPFSKLNFFFNIGMWTWTVMRNRDASECAGTQIVAALSCDG